ncbi:MULTISPECIES: LCP family protein [Micromonospora]|uniref:LytR family transcriptional regulator n=1 Tax=Micromonospora solifontis TaxID=2487138 RepID=A0ABX9WCM8_9ACTN|nr:MULTISPECIES: LCP family protein [Micromonospora]NES12700.1 LytR family transcriptional regulator [Micromonospora sp. PPF5-17B]NES38212.1 LytR family transcriptional regulator [Micromonospora solifontis]NES54415.1 LytR family transcriptional regulator [Micromonospora sp. PPF5-6]RNL96473.1 LytR family transcriptional regulator [Micromonospora solifontis]
MTRRRWVLGLAALVAVLVVAAGAVVVTRLVSHPAPAPVAGSATPTPSAGPPTPASPTPPPGADLKGPLNLLLIGVDTRVSVPGWEPHADSVLVLHVPAGLDRAYLFSLPRDLVVDIPKYAKSGYPGGRTKLTHAMSYGSRVPGDKLHPSTAQGYELLRNTVSRYTGLRIDAGAVITFTGFDKLVTALGGVDLYVDQRVASIHRRPDGHYRDRVGSTYVGPQMVYQKGNRHLNGWQALDYARQRYTAGGDYTRQRHQQQLIRALARKILDQELARDPDRVQQVVDRLGQTLVYIGGGRRLIDFAYALGGLPGDRFVLVGLPGDAVGSGGSYRGEQLEPVGRQFLAALRGGTADAFLKAHPTLRVKT